MTAPEGPAAAGARRPRVVVVAMKPQLRGRIRRNVQTLLDMGAEVLVVTVDGGKDFRQGLDDPRLHVRFEQPLSVLTGFNHALRLALGRGSARRPALPPPPDPTAPVPAQPALQLLARLPLGAARRARRDLIRGTRRVLLPWHRVSLWADFWRRSALTAVRAKPDLVVSSDVPGIVGAAIAARRLGVKHLHDCHELYLESTHLLPVEKRLLAPLEKRLMLGADTVTCVNQSIADEYRARYGVDSVVVRNCAPRPRGTARLDIRQLAGLPDDELVVLYQGGFAPGRGLDVVVRAAAGLPARTSLVLLGDGHHRAELERLVEELGVGHRLRFVAAVPPADLLPLTATATVGVVPYQPVSLNNRLALPNKVFEYTGAGVPLVVADAPELRRVVTEGACGEVYDPYDPDSLVSALARVLDPAGYDRTRAAAAAYGRDNCWEVEREKLVSALTGLSPLWPSAPEPSAPTQPAAAAGEPRRA